VKRKLLIVEDEVSQAKQLKWYLGEDYDVIIAGSFDQARPLLASEAFPVVILDLGLPPHPDSPQEGFKLLEAISDLSPHTKAIVITGNDEKDNAIQAIALGAADFCSKPIELDLLMIILDRTYRLHELEEANRQLKQQGEESYSFCGMLGISDVMRNLFQLIRQLSNTDYPILIQGESGTGKEMVARAIHSLSPRAKGSLVTIDCGAIPENLLESELFGYEKGAFTGASGRKIGKFERADGGTVLLDEISEIPLALQVKILRFLQEGTVERVGGNRTIEVDARVLAASNVDLKSAVQRGSFREDLYFRVNVVPLRVPPLRDRQEDIILLAHHFMQQESRDRRHSKVIFSPAASAALAAHKWPGNVRELQNRIRRALATSTSGSILPKDLGLGEVSESGNDERLPTLKEARESAEKKTIRKALALTRNNISQAAKLLEVSRPTLHDMLKKHSLDKTLTLQTHTGKNR